MQTRVKAIIAYVIGILLVMAEPIFLLIKGEDIVNAIWPAAVRSLDLSFALRDNMGVFFGLMTFAIIAIIVARIAYSKSEFLQKKVSETNPKDRRNPKGRTFHSARLWNGPSSVVRSSEHRISQRSIHFTTSILWWIPADFCTANRRFKQIQN